MHKPRCVQRTQALGHAREGRPQPRLVERRRVVIVALRSNPVQPVRAVEQVHGNEPAVIVLEQFAQPNEVGVVKALQ